MLLRARLAALLVVPALAGCAAWLPSADRLDVQQGNVLAAASIQQLEPGQSRQRVRELIGDPITATTFHADRWDYVYYKTEAGLDADVQRLTLFFGPAGLERVVDRYRTPDDPLPDAPKGRVPEPERPEPAPGQGPGRRDSPMPGPG